MRNPRNSFGWQRITFIALVIAAGSFGLSLLLLRDKPDLNGIAQSRQEQATDSESVSAKGVTQQAKVLKSALLDSWEQEAKAKSLFSDVPAQFQGINVYEAKLNSPDKVIALTFDDGPWPKTTSQVLDILHQHHIKATFFWIGQNLELYPGIAQQVVAYGHAIGNHTWHHWYRPMNQATAASEIDRTAGLIYKTTGITTSLFRPPGGFLHNGVADYAKKKKYVVVMWSDEAREFQRSASPQTLVNDVLKNAKPGEIVLLHDGGGNHAKTVTALPQIIAGLEQRGYRFVTVPELLEMQQQNPVLTTVAKSPSQEKRAAKVKRSGSQAVKTSAG